MTNHVARLHAGALALLVFFLVWAVVAARPWAQPAETDPRAAALERREQRLARESRRVNRVVERRFATYRRRLARRQREIAAAGRGRTGGGGAVRRPRGRSGTGGCRAAAGGRDRGAARDRHGELLMRRLAFSAMGTRVECLLEAAPSRATRAALARVREEFDRLERVFSRFRRDSELSRLNAAGAIEASDDLLAVVKLALAARERTNGRFDPTLHDALVAAGYDRTFADLEAALPAEPLRTPSPPARWSCAAAGWSWLRACGSTSAGSSRASPPTAAPSGSRRSGRAW